MNILAVSHGFSQGGAQISTLEFLEHLGEEVNKKVIVCENSEKKFLENLEKLGIEYKLVPCYVHINVPNMIIDTVEDWIRWADVVWITDLEFLVASKIKKAKNVPVVAHLHSYPLLCPWWGLLYGLKEVCYEGCSLWRIIRCKQLFNRELSRLGIISRVEGTIYWFLDFAKGPLDYFKWRRVINRNLLDSIDAFVAVSNFVKRVHEELLPIQGKPVETVYNPVTYPLKYAGKFGNVDEDRTAEENLVVYASGSNPVKGPHILLQAAKLLLDEGHDMKLVMFGCKGTWVEKQALKLGLGGKVICMGREPLDTLYRYMFRAKAVVMPSICPESFGRVPVEANRLGTPAVATDRGGLPETVLNGETGIVVKPSVKDLASGILKVLNIKKGSTITTKSLQFINPEASISRLINLFQKLL